MLTTRRFPGITFRTETPVQVDLPRMDIAAFVGFAQRGPTNTPVPVESFSEFEDLFGGLYRLAWDEATATGQTACLAPAVKAFFTQGGRRCWIVRVASKQAISNQFLLSGLLQPNGAGGYTSVVATARSVGSWSDNLQARLEAEVTLLKLFKESTVSLRSELFLPLAQLQGQPLEIGDVLQVDCTDDYRGYVCVEAIGLDTAGQSLAVQGQTYWFQRLTLDQAKLLKPGTVRKMTPMPSTAVLGKLTIDQNQLTLAINVIFLSKLWFHWVQNQYPINIFILFLCGCFYAVEAGDWLQLEATLQDQKQVCWLLMGSGYGYSFHVQAAWREVPNTSQDRSLEIKQIQRIRITLRVREEQDNIQPLSNLGCAAPHPRFIGALPEDNTLLDPGFGKPHAELNPPTVQLWQEVKDPRFPLSFVSDNGKSPPTVYLPLGLEASMPWRGAIEYTLEPLERDGLVPASGQSWSDFMTELFLDPALGTTGQRSLVTEANDRLYLQGQALTGLHALFPVEEVSLLALPDAAHRAWEITRREPVTLPKPPEPKPPSDPCLDPSSLFRHKEADAPPAKTVSQIPKRFKVEERAVWRLVPEPQYETSGLLKIQLAAAKLAAARGDMVAVLGLPKHYRLSEIGPYQQQLMVGLQLVGDTTASYVALYHPWLVNREDTGDLIHTHPAGGVCGVIAARSLARGAWVAPANEVLPGTLATVPNFQSEDEFALYSHGINPIRQSARGFVLWGEHTQSAELELEDLNVRRLLILLRRIALTEGQTYVFAPNSPAFRRRIQQQFEQLLGRLYSLGAFAGDSPSAAYRVAIDETVNPANRVEQGQLVVELRVAPSQPLTFMTVRLVQLEGGDLTLQEGINYVR
jgi:hypothetical protein